MSPCMSDLSFSLSSCRDNHLNSDKPPLRFSLMSCAKWWLQVGQEDKHRVLSVGHLVNGIFHVLWVKKTAKFSLLA